jgi:hypothetical protein
VATTLRGGVERAGVLAGLLAGELAEEVFVDPTEDVVGAVVVGLGEADGADEVHELAQAAFVQAFAAVVAGQDAANDGVLGFDGVHGGVEVGADGGEFGAGLDGVPAGVGGDPEHVVGGVFVAGF